MAAGIVYLTQNRWPDLIVAFFIAWVVFVFSDPDSGAGPKRDGTGPQ